MLLWKFYTYSR